MKRLGGLFWGLILGAALMYGGMNYHTVRAVDGWHFIPKKSAHLTSLYVDIREFSIQDWNEQRELAADIMLADKPYLLEQSAKNTVRDALDQVFSTDEN